MGGSVRTHVRMSQGVSKCRVENKDCFWKVPEQLSGNVSFITRPVTIKEGSEITCSFHLSMGFLELLLGTNAVGMTPKISPSSQMCRRAGNSQIVREMLQSRASLREHRGAVLKPQEEMRRSDSDIPG